LTSDILLSLTEIATYVFYIAIALLILMLMITIHELGHYLAGKMLKFKIDEFSIGFGKALFTKKTKSGEIFSVRLIPLGGYCAFTGEDGDVPQEENKNQNNENTKLDETSTITIKTEISAQSQDIQATKAENIKSITKKENLETFSQKAPWKRIIVLFAGVFFNFISAIIFSIILLCAFGYDIPQIKSVDQAGINAHLKTGDIITHVEGERVDYIYGSTLNELLQKYNTNEINITIKRDGQTLETMLYKEVKVENGKEVGYLNLSVGPYKHTFGEALVRAVPLTLTFAWKILEFLGLLITGQVGLDSITGPVTTIGTIASYTQQSIANLFVFLPFISVNLAVFNLLPIPSLDGSKIIFTTIEWIRGRPINPKVENAIHTFGLLALLALVVFVDVFHIFFT